MFTLATPPTPGDFLQQQPKTAHPLSSFVSEEEKNWGEPKTEPDRERSENSVKEIAETVSKDTKPTKGQIIPGYRTCISRFPCNSQAFWRRNRINPTVFGLSAGRSK